MGRAARDHGWQDVERLVTEDRGVYLYIVECECGAKHYIRAAREFTDMGRPEVTVTPERMTPVGGQPCPADQHTERVQEEEEEKWDMEGHARGRGSEGWEL